MAAYRLVYDSHHLQARDQLRNPTLGNRVWATFTFLPASYDYVCSCSRLRTARSLQFNEDDISRYNVNGTYEYSALV